MIDADAFRQSVLRRMEEDRASAQRPEAVRMRREQRARASRRNRDIRCDDPEAAQLIDDLSSVIVRVLSEKRLAPEALSDASNLSSAESAEKLASPPFDGLPLRTLFRCLTALDHDVTVVVRPTAEGRPARLAVARSDG